MKRQKIQVYPRGAPDRAMHDAIRYGIQVEGGTVALIVNERQDSFVLEHHDKATGLYRGIRLDAAAIVKLLGSAERPEIIETPLTDLKLKPFPWDE